MLVVMLAASWLTVPSSAARRGWSLEADDACITGGKTCGGGAPEYVRGVPEGVGGGRYTEGALEYAGGVPVGVGGGRACVKGG
ncbi:hypothetical protein CDL15_Pgr026155 [Punica granatum]|uniref:Uncharacterized protein n=1 Tax=Punica granatum TaxID=22663 RepID=A0A218W755_PUNGR|nr:hypothetical protein CDL15_Pgr026155 [Punica granatum]